MWMDCGKVVVKWENDGHMANLRNPAAVYDQWGPMLQGPPSITGISVRHDLGKRATTGKGPPNRRAWGGNPSGGASAGMSIHKKESILSAALAYIEELRDHHRPMLRAADMHELRLAHETSNMILNADLSMNNPPHSFAVRNQVSFLRFAACSATDQNLLLRNKKIIKFFWFHPKSPQRVPVSLYRECLY